MHTAIVESVQSGAITTIHGNYRNRVSRVGPFHPGTATSPARILGYASPVSLSGAVGALAGTADTTPMVRPPTPTLVQIRSQDGGH